MHEDRRVATRLYLRSPLINRFRTEKGTRPRRTARSLQKSRLRFTKAGVMDEW